MVLPLSRGREGRFVQEATTPEASDEGLWQRKDQSPAGSHNPQRPGAPVSIAMAPQRGGIRLAESSEKPRPLLPALGLPRPGVAPPELTRLRAPRDRWGHSPPGRKVGSSQRAAAHSIGPAHLHGNAPAAPRRPPRDNPASTAAPRVPHARPSPPHSSPGQRAGLSPPRLRRGSLFVCWRP